MLLILVCQISECVDPHLGSGSKSEDQHGMWVLRGEISWFLVGWLVGCGESGREEGGVTIGGKGRGEIGKVTGMFADVSNMD